MVKKSNSSELFVYRCVMQRTNPWEKLKTVTESNFGAEPLTIFLKILETMETQERFGHASHQFWGPKESDLKSFLVY